jgi:hypothetical protein
MEPPNVTPDDSDDTDSSDIHLPAHVARVLVQRRTTKPQFAIAEKASGKASDSLPKVGHEDDLYTDIADWGHPFGAQVRSPEVATSAAHNLKRAIDEVEEEAPPTDASSKKRNITNFFHKKDDKSGVDLDDGVGNDTDDDKTCKMSTASSQSC